MNDKSDAPKHHDLASVMDASGFYNGAVIAYWDSLASYESWRASSGFNSWWESLDPTTERHRWFCEIFTLSMIESRRSIRISSPVGRSRPRGDK